MILVAKECSFSIDVNGYNPLFKFSQGFEKIFLNNFNKMKHTGIAIVCIGTDRSTGDSLGPLVGYKLRTFPYRDKENIKVYGTLENHVHAKNLNETINQISLEFEAPYIIAIDACLGRPERVGYITVGTGPVLPGAGVNKNLPEIGDMHIKGIVNVGGFMEYLVLQNTRLNLVMKMADIISAGIRYVILRNISKTVGCMSES